MLPIKYIQTHEEKDYLKTILKKTGYNGLIPSHVILNKIIPGLGATSCEIESERNSAVILPYIPAILSKKSDYPNARWQFEILAVYEETTGLDITRYLLNDNIPFKKIVTTPEGFINKVLKVFGHLGISYTEEYFLLIDESEKIIQDVNFRGSLFEIMKAFWLFKNKAMVSATPLMPSDKLFKQENFTQLIVKPTYNYQEKVVLTPTNSILNCVKELVEELSNIDGKICFFINSIETIVGIIKTLKIESDYKIYCSDKSVKKLETYGLMSYSTVVSQDAQKYAQLNKFNFFTSRFFSGVDIRLKKEYPTVILVTDIYFAPQTALDPATEVKQIIGRFRNEVGLTYHIFNTKNDLPLIETDRILKSFEVNKSVFQSLFTLYRNEKDNYKKRIIREIYEKLDFFKYVYPYKNQLKVNYYMLDNELEKQRVKDLYKNQQLLEDKYNNDSYYNILVRPLSYKQSDRIRYKRNKFSVSELRKEIIEVYDRILHGTIDGMLEDYFSDYELEREQGYITGVYAYLGKENLENLNYNKALIDDVLAVLFDERATNHPSLIKYINKSFQVGCKYSEAYISFKLGEIFTMFNVNKNIVATRLQQYCQTSKRVAIGKRDYKMFGEDRPKGYLITEHRFIS